MDNTIFEDYFKRTVLRGKDAVPSYEELRDMENRCIEALMNQKKSDFAQYRFLFGKYGLELISRISFCNRSIDNGSASPEVHRLKSSYERFRINLRSLDRSLYEKELRTAIQKEKRKRKTKAQVLTPQPTIEPQQKEVKAPFLKTSLTKEKAASLYDTLVNGGYLADTGKDDFIYYFTGKGEQPKNTLEWKTDAVILSILAECFSPNRIPWKELSGIFGGLNIDSMKTNLSRERNKFREGYQQTSYEKHRKMIDEWLK